VTRGESLAVVLGVIVALAVAGWYYYGHQTPMPNISEPDQAAERIVTVGDTSIYVETVDTEAAREQGLSGRANLAPNSGMLFVFDTDGTWGIWMKDMQFSIDIVWLAADGTVITVVPNATPQSYPKAFYPSAPARYVIELPAGFTADHAIGVGSKFVL